MHSWQYNSSIALQRSNCDAAAQPKKIEMLFRQKAKIANFVFGSWSKPVENNHFFVGGRQFFTLF
jgi:hypothetical protein